VGVTTVIMLLALRTRSKGLIFTILPFYVAMCFSTVYIYAHYAIDAIAGLLTGTLLYITLKRLYLS
jgi:membrane-associated phospholipid phosphatase